MSNAPDESPHDIPLPDYIQRRIGEAGPEFTAEWRISYMPMGSTYCLPIASNGRPSSDEILDAIAEDLNADSLAWSGVEWRQEDSDEPWQCLEGYATPAEVTEALIQTLEESCARLTSLTLEQKDRVVAAVRRFGL